MDREKPTEESMSVGGEAFKISRRKLFGTMAAGAMVMVQDSVGSAQDVGSEINSTGTALPKAAALPVKDGLARLGDSVALRGECAGEPVYGFGYSYVYGISPDFVLGTKVQDGNDAPVVKVRPKKSWEITSHKLGATPPREPRTARTDQQPFLGVSLIDGDPDTYWGCRGQCRPDVEPVWVRIDLAVEAKVKSVVIIPRADNRGMPGNLTIKVSRDAWHWETVYQNAHYQVPNNTEPRVFAFDPRPVKQIWIIGTDLPLLEWFYCMSIAGVQVTSEKDENLALISRGAGVTVSSCDFGITSEREMHQMLWGVHYDVGFKWVRVGYAGPGAVNWNFVERKKGHYEVDPETDRAITEMLNNGVNIVLCLGFTNWLYTPAGEPDSKEAKHTWEGTEAQSRLPSPAIPGMLEGYLNFVRFMVRHFKNRVRYFEVWNEQSGDYGGLGDIKLYSEYVRRAVPVIRAEYPEARIVLGSVSGFGVRREFGIDYLKKLLSDGLGRLVDGIGWHPCYGCDPAGAVYRTYPQEFQKFKEFAEAHGFKGEYMNTEWDMFASYPTAPQYVGKDSTQADDPKQGVYEMTDSGSGVTELMKAKHAARFALIDVGLDVTSFWNETWSNAHIDRDVGLFRNTFSMEPINPTQPQPVYYVIRTLCTVLDGATPASFEVRCNRDASSFELVTFDLPNGDRLVSISLAARSKDASPEVRTNVNLPGQRFKSAIGIDVLNGTEQQLKISNGNDGTTLEGLLVKDYPIVLKLLRHAA